MSEKVQSYRECIRFPGTLDEFIKSYGFTDDKEVYTNGSELIPVFSVKQWLDHIEPCEDAVSREAVIVGIRSYWHDEYYQRVPITEEREDLINEVINHLSPVTPIQRMGKWVFKNGAYICKCGCRESNRTNYCPNCGLKMMK